MKNIRIGNDIWFKWQILRGEGVETWNGKDIKVTLRDSYGMECAVDWRKDEGGVINGVCRGRAQKRLGLYTLTLTENDGKDNMGCVDSVDAWRLVARQNASIVDEEERDGALGVEVVMLTSKVGIGNGEGITIDTELNEESNNAIANAAVTNKFSEQEAEMTEMQGRIDNNATDIASKASQAELSRMRNDLEKADTANSNAIAEVREALAGKADSTEVTNSVNELKAKDTAQEETIAQQQEAVAANTSTIAEHTATLAAHDSRITANNDKITALEAKTIDAELSETSENAVQNKAVTAAVNSRLTEEVACEKIQNGSWIDIRKGTGLKAVAIGNGTQATGQYSYAEGDRTQAKSYAAHAEGTETIASGSYSHTEGTHTKALGDESHAEGGYCIAQGHSSHAEGNSTTAQERYSHAEGMETIAQLLASHAEGVYNFADKTFISMIGVGEYENRLNAEAVYVKMLLNYQHADTSAPKNGYKYLLDVGGYKGKAIEEGMKSVQEVFVDLETNIANHDAKFTELETTISGYDARLAALDQSALIIKAKGNGAQINIDGTNTDIEANKRVVKKGFTNITFTSTTSYEMNRRANIVFVSIQNFKPNSMYNMFRKCSGLTRINVDGWDTSAVGDMRNVFMECSSLRGLDLSSWDTTSATDMRYMFSYCQAATEIDVRGWNTANVTNMDGVFRACSQLTSIDVSSWDTSKVQSMEYMFAECPKLRSLDLSSWNLLTVNNIRNIFAGSGEIEELTLGEHFGRVQKWAGSIDFSPLTKWTGSSVQTLRSLCNRKDFGIGTLTLKLSSQTKAALGSDGISQLTAKGYTIA